MGLAIRGCDSVRQWWSRSRRCLVHDIVELVSAWSNCVRPWWFTRNDQICRYNFHTPTIRFGFTADFHPDIDGDGYAEYLYLGGTGSLTGYLNTGQGFGNKPVWEFMGQIAGGIGDRAGVHLVDLNGDGRVDYLWLDSKGAATAYINYRGHAAGMAPNWIPAGVIATGVGTSRDNITFGDLNGDGKSDYIFKHYATGALDVWLNQGNGGTFVTADGLRFGDINADGKDDYLAVDKNGAIEAYTNGGFDSVNNRWVWYPQGIIASGVGAPRRAIRYVRHRVLKR
jgi:FG-GAP-like repeat